MHVPMLHIPFQHLQQPSTFTANGSDNKRLRGLKDAMEVKSDVANQRRSLSIALGERSMI
jgi:hypothetical protein